MDTSKNRPDEPEKRTATEVTEATSDPLGGAVSADLDPGGVDDGLDAAGGGLVDRLSGAAGAVAERIGDAVGWAQRAIENMGDRARGAVALGSAALTLGAQTGYAEGVRDIVDPPPPPITAAGTVQTDSPVTVDADGSVRYEIRGPEPAASAASADRSTSRHPEQGHEIPEGIEPDMPPEPEPEGDPDPPDWPRPESVKVQPQIRDRRPPGGWGIRRR